MRLLRQLLQLCREASDSVHRHLEAHGVSADLCSSPSSWWPGAAGPTRCLMCCSPGELEAVNLVSQLIEGRCRAAGAQALASKAHPAAGPASRRAQRGRRRPPSPEAGAVADVPARRWAEGRHRRHHDAQVPHWRLVPCRRSGAAFGRAATTRPQSFGLCPASWTVAASGQP